MKGGVLIIKSKEEKKTEANWRQKEYDDLSITEKISRAKDRRGQSSKEISKLKRRLKK
jgi:hypothetical protein|tara:strand:- start:925 stop:1098 length:174 start_codon:yes stop_codon:yes gene_type:complete